jgi:hypothetical protein
VNLALPLTERQGSLTAVVRGPVLVAEDGDLKLLDSAPLVPWMAKVDANGNLLWQYFYYETHRTGRTLSEYFASSTLTGDGGALALGFTENPNDFLESSSPSEPTAQGSSEVAARSIPRLRSTPSI